MRSSPHGAVHRGLEADGEEGQRHDGHAPALDAAGGAPDAGALEPHRHRVRSAPAVTPRPTQYMACERSAAPSTKNR